MDLPVGEDGSARLKPNDFHYFQWDSILSSADRSQSVSGDPSKRLWKQVRNK